MQRKQRGDKAKWFMQGNNPRRFGVSDLGECNKLREIRNRVIHEGYGTNKEEAARFKAMAEKALW